MTNPLFDRLFAKHTGKSKPFLRLVDGTTVSYAAFLGLAAQIAHLLTQSGLQAGDRLAAQVQKSHEALALYAACVQAGVVFLPLNVAYTTEEVSYFIEDSGARMIVCDGKAEGALSTIAARLGASLETLNQDGTGTLMESTRVMPEAFPTVARSSEDLAALLYTSGTTGRSKGAMLSQGNLLSNAETLAKEWQFTPDDVLLHALPIFHTHGLFVATNVTLVSGASMIFLPQFNVDQLVGLMPDATVLMGVPTFYTRLLDHPQFDRHRASGIRLFVSGSAPLLAETHVQFADRTGHHILERYGMTETNMNTSNPYDGERRAGTVGLPLSGVEVKVTDPETGATLPENTVGQIEVRGPNVFKGYWQMPQKTAAELRGNGFFTTGDLGKIDEEGYVHILGRNKDLIISGGYNIYPKEIELVLDAQPGVLESAVIGVPHRDLGETVVGLIVSEPGGQPDLEQIMEAIQTTLARFKQPRRLIVVPELPRNAMAKVQKNILREQFRDVVHAV